MHTEDFFPLRCTEVSEYFSEGGGGDKGSQPLCIRGWQNKKKMKENHSLSKNRGLKTTSIQSYIGYLELEKGKSRWLVCFYLLTFHTLF